MMRIDKYLAEMGQGTRSEIKKLIRTGYDFLAQYEGGLTQYDDT